MERYIAIDNVCAWPNLTKMPDGALIATIFNQPCHGRWEGDVECWASEDGGRSWHLRGVPAPHEPGTNRMNVAVGLARNGDLVVLASGWSHRPRKGEGAAGHEAPAHPLLPWVCRSSDGGRTWTHAETLAPPAGMDHIVPFGDVVPLADGCLGGSLYGGHAAYFYASPDDGRTWALRSAIRDHDINETTLLALPGGDLLACARTEGDQHLDLFRSTDHGRTWRCEQAVSQGSQHPADLLNLGDGRVLLTYGDRRGGHEGIEARVSDDGGRTWGVPLRVVELEPGDLGYPATVPGKDGTLVTVWYCSGIAAHQRYHVGASAWRLAEVEEAACSAPVCEWMVSALQPKTGGIADAPCRGLDTSLGWTPIQANARDRFVNVHDRLGDADGLVYFAQRFQVPQSGCWELRVGHDGGVRVFVDGQAVLTEPETRNPATPDRSRVEVALGEGEHEIVIAFDTAAGRGWGIFCSWVIPPAQRSAKSDRLFPRAV
jgi:hypothetical protein